MNRIKHLLLAVLMTAAVLPAVAEEVITFTADDLTGTNNFYELKEGTSQGIIFKSFSYLNIGKFQFNNKYRSDIMYNITPIPGSIKSLKVTKDSGTDRNVTAYISKTPMDISNFAQAIPLGSKTVTSDGTVWNLSDEQIAEGYTYFYFHYSTESALFVSSFEVSYLEDSSKKHVTYNPNGATNGTVPVDATEYESGDEVTVLGNLGNLEKTGFTFSGWNTAADGSGADYSEGDTFNFTEHATLYAKWEINSYNVSWKVNGETWFETTTVDYGQKVGSLPPNPTSADFDGEREFVGWTDVEIEDTDTRPQLLFLSKDGSPEITQDVTFHAVFASVSPGEHEKTYSAANKTQVNTPPFYTNRTFDEYAASNAPYRIKLDTTGDYIQFHQEGELPFIATIGWKKIGGAGVSTITLQGSTDGTNYVDINSYTTPGTQNTTGSATENITNYTYLRWVFTKGSNIGVNVSVTCIDVSVYSNYATHCTPSAAVTAIEVTTSPTKTQYVVGEEIDLQGGEITVSYDNDTSSVMSMTAHGVTVSGYDKDTAGEQTITVAYKGKTATFTVVVSGPPSCNITWSVNRVGQSTQQNQGSTISFPENPEAIGDFVFIGWTATYFEGTREDDTDITYIGEGSIVPSSDETTYYAVFAKQTGTVVSRTDTHSSDHQNAAWSSSPLGSNYSAKPKFKMDNTGDYIMSPSYSGRITNVKFLVKGNGTNNASKLKIFGIKNNTQTELESLSITNNTTDTKSIDITGEFTGVKFEYKKSEGNIGIDDFVVTYDVGGASYSDYCINVPGEKPTPIISFSPTQVTAFLDDMGSFVKPTLNQEGYICSIDSWESSEPNVATVDEDGNVEIIAEGVTSITAVINETDEHNGASATYRLIVEETALTDVTFNFEDPNEWMSWGVDLSNVDPDVNTFLSEMTPMPDISKSGLTVTWIDVVSSTTTNQKVNIKKYQQTDLFTIRVPSGTKLLISGSEGVEIESVTYNYYEDSKPDNPLEDKTISPTDNVCTIEGKSSHKPFIKNLIVHLRPKPIDVQISTAQYATLYYSWKNLKVPTGLECITYTYTEGDNKVVPTISYRAGDIIPAGEGVVLHANPEVAAKTTYQFDVIRHADNLMPVENNVLQGTDFNKLVIADEGKYIYRLINGTKGVGFYMSTKGDGYEEGKSYRNGAHKAYLQVTYKANGTAAGSAPAFISLIPDDVAENITDIERPNDSPVYNIVGQKVNANYKGIIIVGGKKYSNR